MEYTHQEVNDKTSLQIDEDTVYTKDSKAYSRLVVLEQTLRAEGFVPRIASENTLEVKKSVQNGLELLLKSTVSERTVAFQITIPMGFKSGHNEVISLLNQMNNDARKGNRSEFWSLGDKGHVHLYSILIDNDQLDFMKGPVSYLVCDMFEFAEYGYKRLESEMSEKYAPSEIEPTFMYW